MNNLIIFYFGSSIIIGIYVYLIYFRLKTEDKIDFKKHFFLIVIYIILIIGSIFTWGVIYKLIINNFNKALQTNKNVEKIMNG